MSELEQKPGYKNDAGKPRYDLIPPEALEELARLFGAGVTVCGYPERNWEAGMEWGRGFRAMMSHAWKWWGGEEIDDGPGGSGCHHLASVAWCAFVLYTYHARKIGTDTRSKVQRASPTDCLTNLSESDQTLMKGLRVTPSVFAELLRRASEDDTPLDRQVDVEDTAAQERKTICPRCQRHVRDLAGEACPLVAWTECPLPEQYQISKRAAEQKWEEEKKWEEERKSAIMKELAAAKDADRPKVDASAEQKPVELGAFQFVYGHRDMDRVTPHDGMPRPPSCDGIRVEVSDPAYPAAVQVLYLVDRNRCGDWEQLGLPRLPTTPNKMEMDLLPRYYWPLYQEWEGMPGRVILRDEFNEHWGKH